MGLGCKEPNKYQEPAIDRTDGGQRDARGGAGGGLSGSPGTGGTGAPAWPGIPDANDPPPDLTPDATGDTEPSPTCVANLPCSQGISPCRQGATTCATPTSEPACTDVGADDTKGGCTGINVCLGGACVAPCATSSLCTEGIKPCRKGATTCATPTSGPVCADVGADDTRGGCPGDNVCSNGSCVAPCKANVPCTQGLGPCRKGVTTCASPTAQPVCMDAGADDTRGGCSGGNMCRGGTCVAPPPITCDGQPIGSGRCSGTVHQSCSGNGQWVADSSAECKRADGGQCSAGSDCKSGNCSSGICCDSPCTGRCMSCSNAETGRTNGSCAPVRAGSDPRNQCDSGICRTGNCDGNGGCGVTSNGQGSTGCDGPCRQCNNGSCQSISDRQASGCDANARCDSEGEWTADRCENGQCRKGTRRVCQNGCSGNRCSTCITCYPDLDGDGFGNGDAPLEVCSASPACASGYTRDNRDCWDQNAKAHPGAPYSSDDPGNRFGALRWDYNCDGKIDYRPDPKPEGCVCQGTEFGNVCMPDVPCVPKTVPAREVGCGEPYSVVTRCELIGQSCGAIVADTRHIECR